MTKIISNSNYKIISGYIKPGDEAARPLAPEEIGRACSNPISKAWTWTLQSISFGYLRGNYYENYGNKVLKGYFTQKASEERKPEDKALNQRIARAWQKAQYDPKEEAAKNFVHAQELLKKYDKKNPAKHKALDTLIKQAVTQLNSAYKDPPGDRSQWNRVQKEAINRLDAIEAQSDRVKAAYEAFSDDNNKVAFLDLLKKASEEGKLKEFLDAHQIIKTLQIDAKDPLLELQKVFEIDDLKSKIPTDLSDRAAIQAFYGAHIRLTKEHVLGRVKEAALRQALEMSGMDPEAMNSFINRLEAREKALEPYLEPSLHANLVAEHRGFLAAGNLTERERLAAERAVKIAQIFHDNERREFLKARFQNYKLFETGQLEKFEQDFVSDRTEERIQVIEAMAKNFHSKIAANLTAPIKQMGGDNERELKYLEEVVKWIPHIQAYLETYDETLVQQLAVDLKKAKKVMGQDLEADMKTLQSMKIDQALLDEFYIRLGKTEDPYAKVLKAFTVNKNLDQILEFLRLSEAEKLKRLRPHLKHVAPQLVGTGLMEPFVGHQGKRTAEEMINILVKVNPHSNEISTIKTNLTTKNLSVDEAWKAIALFLLERGASGINKDEIKIDYILAQGFKMRVASKKPKLFDSEVAEAFAEYLTRETVAPHLFYDLSLMPRNYYLEMVSLGYELIEAGLTPKQAAQAVKNHVGLLEELKKKTSIKPIINDRQSLIASMQRLAEDSFQLDLLIDDIKSNPIRLIKVLFASLLRGLPHNEREVAALERQLDLMAPEFESWLDLLEKSISDNPEEAKNTRRILEVIINSLSVFKIGLSRETFNKLIQDTIDSALQFLGNDPNLGPNKQAVAGINTFLEFITPELRKQENREILKGIKKGLPLVKGGVKLAVFLSPLISGVIKLMVEQLPKASNAFFKYQFEKFNQALVTEEDQLLQDLLSRETPSPGEIQQIQKLQERKAKFGVLTAPEKMRNLVLLQDQKRLLDAFLAALPVFVPPVIKMLVEIERNHPGVVDELGKIVDALMIKPIEPPVKDQAAFDALDFTAADQELAKSLNQDVLREALRIAASQQSVEELIMPAIKQARQQVLYDLSKMYCSAATPKPKKSQNPLVQQVLHYLREDIQKELYEAHFKEALKLDEASKKGFQDALFNFGIVLVKDLQKDKPLIDSLLKGLVDNYSAAPSPSQAAKS